MKRKQKDFQKTKLKVGRKVSKGANVTDTSFKTKKIIAPQQKLESSAEKSLTELLGYLNTTNATQKKDTLKKIDRYIEDNLDSLFLHFPDVLLKLGKVVLESDPELPLLAVNVITTCVGHLSEIQYKSFSPNMMLHLNVMMSHGAMTVKKASLKLLEALVTAHPKVLTGQTKILFSLLNMISKEKNGKRTLVEHVSRTMTSANWHQQVLQHVRLFLQELVEIEDNKAKIAEELKVIERPTGPNSLKVDMSWYSNPTPSNEDEFEKFVKGLLQILSVLSKEASKHIQQDCTSDGSLVSKNDAKHLNMIVQLMCYVGEMDGIKINFKENKDDHKLFLEIISTHLMNGFPYEQQGKVDPNKITELESYQLNLGICYLYTVFILDSGEQVLMDKRIINFFEQGFRAALRMTERSIRLILKLSRTIIRSTHIDIELKNAILVSVYELLQLYKDTDYAEAIYSFFTEISLDYQYKDALQTLAMDSWFQSLMGELTMMKEKNLINVKLLKCIQQLCLRKYPEYLKVLKEDFGGPLLQLLVYDNEEFQTTIMSMIMAVDLLPDCFLRSLSDLICENSLTPNMFQKLLRQLYIRYSTYNVSNKEKLLFVKFLLNVACDMKFPIDPSTEVCNKKLINVVFSTFEINTVRIYPTTKWKTHKTIYEACMQYLLMYEKDKLVQQGIHRFAQTFAFYFSDNRMIPVHTVLAFLSIRQKIGYMFEDRTVISFCYCLAFSAFMYNSIVTTEAFEESISYCVPELSQMLLSFCDSKATTFMFGMHERYLLNYRDDELYNFLKAVRFLNNLHRIEPYYMDDLYRVINMRLKQSAVLASVWQAFFPTY